MTVPPASTARHIVVVDVFLKDKTGHPYRINRVAHDAAAERGIDYRTLCAEQNSIAEPWALPTFKSNALIPPFTVKNLFRLLRRVYRRRAATAGGTPEVVQRLSVDERRRSSATRLLVAAVDVLNVVYLNARTYVDLRRVLRQCAVDGQTLLMVQPVHVYMIFGFWLWCRVHGWSTGAQIVLFVEERLSPAVYRAVGWLFGRRVRFAVWWTPVGQDIQQYCGQSAVFIADPFDCGQPTRVTLKDKLRTQLVAGFLGGFRVVKGVETLTRAIHIVSLTPASRARVRFVVQGNLWMASAVERQLLAELDALARAYPTFLTVVHRALDHDEYYSLLRKLDVVVLPYKTDGYYGLTPDGHYSGILLEALSANKLAVVSSDTQLAADGGRRVHTFTAGDAQALARSVLHAVDPCVYYAHVHANEEYARQLAAEHAPRTYITKLLALALP